ncbi:MAG: hypothetical protein KYX68_08125, partial [Flavobacterium sp.]|nr:hypothetical protein [Flavobacterium sp.]
QDLKLRHIHVILPIMIFLSSYFLIKSNLKIISINLFFLITTLSIMTLYMCLKNKQFLNPFEHYFGLGDLLFYLAIAPLFFLYNYILFFVVSMLFAIIIQKLFQKFIRHDSVPLAGLSALLLLIILGNDLLLSFHKITLIKL